MTEKPIFFNTDTIRMILENRKNQTRQIVNPQPPEGYNPEWSKSVKCLCQSGDVLWVKEEWRIGAWDENEGTIRVDYKADNYSKKEWVSIEDSDLFNMYWWQSTEDAIKAGLHCDMDGKYHWEPGLGPTRWRSPSSMPKAAARIFLKVNDVKMEQLQEITRDDAIAEGCGVECTCCHKSMCANCYGTGWDIFPEIDFQRVWDSIYEKRGHGWEANPWVFVVEFERVKGK